jgi:4-hydroxybenzoate polyprenyltransferase
MIKDYIAIARPDHWFKNVMILPGYLIALLFSGVPISQTFIDLCFGGVAICLVASSNYVLNDWLDAVFDRHHPVKKQRPTVARKLSRRIVYTEYVLLALGGFWVGALVSLPFVFALVALWIQGIIYNVRPLRTKEVAYLDVLSESINNPIRLFAGWFVVCSAPIPPSSLIISYWMGGAFLMAVKRYAEYRYISDKPTAARYRKSFAVYTDESLLISAFFYGACSALFFGVFMVIHKAELVFSLPLLALLFTWYLHLGMKPDSPAQRPEKLYQERGFLLYLLFVVAVTSLLLWLELPVLGRLLENAF